MAAVVTDRLQELQIFYEWALTQSDPRTKDWLLMESPVPTLALCGAYLAVVLVGPKVMASRQAFDLRQFSIIYNLCMVGLSGYMFFELVYTAIMQGYNWYCDGLNYSDDAYSVRMAGALWWYYFSKVIEFTDTFLMVLRKKNNQISFLHVYHHVSMFILWWIAVRWSAGGQLFFGPVCNCLIHCFMYYYYACSAAGVNVWWKKYMTQMQLIQFFATIAHAVNGLVNDCGHPKWMLKLLTGYMCTLVVLFANFYVKTYRQRPAKKDDAKKAQ